MNELRSWLRAVGLEQLAPVLESHDVDFAVLRELGEDDLEKIGLSLGHRKRLLKALEHVAGPAGPALAAPPAQAPPVLPERRLLTVMFCDLVGSTALSARLDPEELREILLAYRDAAAAAITRAEGYIAQYLGDGVLAYFGWPQSHEDDADQAVRAGLAVIEAIAAMPAEGGNALAARIGIATGLVVVGEKQSQDECAVGATPNLAARLQALAEPGTVVVEQTTLRMLGDLFEYQDLGAHPMKGFSLPLNAYRVLRASAIQGRFDAFHAAALTPMIGRHEEFDLLRRLWERAKSGHGQVVLVCGEAGIGKSRLVATLLERIAGEAHTTLRYFCSPHHRGTALHPIVSQIERAAGIERDDDVSTKLDKIDLLFHGGPDEAGDRRLIAELLLLPDLGRYPPVALNPHQRKHKTFDALLRQLDLLAGHQPVLEIFEDVHWIDPTTQEALERTIERIQSLPVLLIVTYRPEFEPAWAETSNTTLLNLSRLDKRDGVALIEQVVGSGVLPHETVMEIVERTDGVPLFVEELAKAVLEAGQNTVEAGRIFAGTSMNAVPPVLHASLMSRLDRLGPAKEVAQIGSVIGRECSYAMLAAVSDLPAAALAAAMDKLTASGLMSAHGTPPESTYLFKHALVQDAAYGTILIGRRQKLHGRIAELIESRFPDQAAREPELVARHFAEAKRPERAIKYWIAAGRQAAERSANLEAIQHLTTALDALGRLPDSEARDRQELAAQTALGTPLISVHGYAATATGAAYTRARVLSRRLNDRAGIYATLSGEYSYYFVRAEHLMMREITQESHAIADALSDESLDLVAKRMDGLSGIHFGDTAAAQAAFESLVETYDAARHRPPPVQYVHDPKIYAVGYLPVILWIRGHPDKARAWSATAMAYAAELNNANMTAFARVYGGAGLFELLGEDDAVHAHAEAVIELARQHNLRYFNFSGMFLRGWLMARQGEVAAGLALMEDSIDKRFELGVGWYQTRYLCMLAETCLQLGDAPAGLSAVARARRHIEAHDEHLWEAEVQRLEAELARLAGAPASAVEAAFMASLATSRAQGARSFELRAATGFAAHCRPLRRFDEARAELEPVLLWFGAGADSADLRRARSMLQSLH